MDIRDLSFKEFMRIINPDGKMHSSSAYDVDLQALNELEGDKWGIAPTIKRMRVAGIDLDLRERFDDRWANDYVAMTEDGEIKRDDDGLAMHLTRPEIEERIPASKRFQYEHAIVERATGIVFGKTQRDWGNTLLIRVGSEVRGLGIGSALLEAHWNRHPFGNTGGVTPAGKGLCHSAYSTIVSKALAGGYYRKCVQAGTLQPERVKSIVDSAEINGAMVANKNAEHGCQIVPFHQRKGRGEDLDMFDSKDWRLWFTDTTAFIYNRKILDWLNTESEDDYELFLERGLVAYAQLAPTASDDLTQIYCSYGQSEALRAFACEVLLNQPAGEELAMSFGDASRLKDRLGDRFKVRKTDRGMLVGGVSEPTISKDILQGLALMEKLERKHDRFGEKELRLQEMFDAHAQHQANLELEARSRKKANEDAAEELGARAAALAHQKPRFGLAR